MTRLKAQYDEKIRPAMQEKFGYTNPSLVPKITKISVNMGLGEATTDSKVVERAAEELARITGQKPIITRAKKSEAGFKIRQDMPIGCKVTLRRDRMFEFLDRFVNVALPRVRDFRGLNPKSFDKNGNFSVGLKEQIVFPEIDYDKIDAIRGMDITIVTTAKTKDEGRALLEAFNLPFRK